MDSHMLDRIREEIELCFMCAKMELQENEIIKDTRDYKTASILISAYNKMVKLYYKKEYINEYLKGNVASEYKFYCENNCK